MLHGWVPAAQNGENGLSTGIGNEMMGAAIEYQGVASVSAPLTGPASGSGDVQSPGCCTPRNVWYYLVEIHVFFQPHFLLWLAGLVSFANV